MGVCTKHSPWGPALPEVLISQTGPGRNKVKQALYTVRLPQWPLWPPPAPPYASFPLPQLTRAPFSPLAPGKPGKPRDPWREWRKKEVRRGGTRARPKRVKRGHEATTVLPGPGQQIGFLRKSPATPQASVSQVHSEGQSAKTSLGNPTHIWFLG